MRRLVPEASVQAEEQRYVLDGISKVLKIDMLVLTLILYVREQNISPR